MLRPKWAGIVHKFCEVLSAVVSLFLGLANHFCLISIRDSFGDTLCLSGVAKELAKNGTVYLVTNKPELIKLDEKKVKPIQFPPFYSKWHGWKYVRYLLMQLNGARVAAFRYRSHRNDGMSGLRSLDKQCLHLTEAHRSHWSCSLRALLPTGPIPPVYVVEENERRASLYKFGLVGTNFTVLFSSAKTSVTTAKNLKLDLIKRAVRENSPGDSTIVQLGMLSDPEVDSANVVDLRGQTSVEEVLHLISAADLVIAPEGFPNHAAASVGTASLVLRTGYTRASYYSYEGTRVQPLTLSPCEHFPCWKAICSEDQKCIT